MIIVKRKDNTADVYSNVVRMVITIETIDVGVYMGVDSTGMIDMSWLKTPLNQVEELIVDGRTIYPTLEQLDGDKYGR